MIEIVFRHIEFLLPQSGCVIIPDLGAFIVNIETAKYDLRGFICPPSYTIVFNQELKYNDGLLANSLQKRESISYEKANKIIKDVVKEIKSILLDKEIFNCGKIGHLCIDKNKNIGFYCNSAIIHPQLWGLDNVYLNKIEAIDKHQKQLNTYPQRKRRYLFASAAAIAATVFLFIMPSPHIITGNTNTIVQQADFINTLTATLNSNSETEVDSKEVTNDIILDKLSINDTLVVDNNQETTAVEEEVTNVIVPLPMRTYYIIIGGEKSEKGAERLLTKYKKKGFEDAAIVRSGNYYRIYIAAFNDKSEAEVFLDVFRIENPEYKTAWLFSKKNS